MYYRAGWREGHFNFANPGEVNVLSWISVYNDKGEEIKHIL